MTPLAGQLSLFELDANPDYGEPARAPGGPSRLGRPLPKASRLDLVSHRASQAVDPLTLLAEVLATVGTHADRTVPAMVDLRQARDDWLRRLQAARRSPSALTAYRIAIDDLLDWSAQDGRSV